MSVYSNKNGQVVTSGQQELNRKQKKVLTTSLLYCAIGFIIMAALTFAFGAIWNATIKGIDEWNTLFTVLFVVSIVLLMASSILSMFWERKMIFKKSDVMTILVWGFFILGNSFAFSLILFMFGHSGGWFQWWYLGLVFLGGAVIFALCGLIGWALTNKGGITLNKIMIILGLIMSGLFLVMFILMFVAIFTPSIYNVTLIFWLIAFAVMFLLILFSTMSTFNDIKRIDQFGQLAGNDSDAQKELVGRLSWVVGFELLCNLTTIIWFLIELLILIGGRRR